MDSKERFSNRVEMYVKYRPAYPPEAIDYLYDVVGLRPGGDVADIGAGTGICSKLLLERGSRVTAVEPNREMREAAEKLLEAEPHVRIVSGSAESTGLPDRSVDAIVCAQSFHWFDRDAARSEFRRILRPGGKVALIWNTRLTEGTPFREECERLFLAYGTDYSRVNHHNLPTAALAAFFRPGGMHEARFPHGQSFDYEGLRGRVLSSSYSPVQGDPRHEPMMRELRSLFDEHQRGGRVGWDYETEVYWGEV